MVERMTGEFLEIKKRGDSIAAVEWNALVRQAHIVHDLRGGYTDESMLVVKESLETHAEWFEILATDAIPAYAVFTIGEGSATYKEPCRPSSEKHGGASSGSPFASFTNGHIAIPAGSIGLCKPINEWETVELKIDGAAPKPGEVCGVKPETYLLTKDDHRFGFVCLSDESTDGRNVHHFLLARNPASIFGEISEVIPAKSPAGTDFERGKVKVKVRKSNQNTWEVILGIWDLQDLEFVVFNHLDQEFAVGDTIVANETLGVGLVVVSGGRGEKVRGIWLCQATIRLFTVTTPLFPYEWSYESNDYDIFAPVGPSSTAFEITIKKTGWYEHIVTLGVEVATSTGTCDAHDINTAVASIQFFNVDADPDPAWESILCGINRITLDTFCATDLEFNSGRQVGNPLLFHNANEKLRILQSASTPAGGGTITFKEGTWSIKYRGDMQPKT